MSIGVNDHYVAQTYLKHFANESGFLWVYSKKWINVQEKSSRGICYEPHWCTNPLLDENPRIIEEYLKDCEGNWNEAVALLSSRKSLTPEKFFEAKRVLSGYIAFLTLFTPTRIQAGLDMLKHSLDEAFNKVKSQAILQPPPPECDPNLLDNLEAIVDIKAAHLFGTNTLLQMQEIVFSSTWSIVFNDHSTVFLTSDNPVCCLPETHGPDSVFIPLTPRMGVIYTPRTDTSHNDEVEDYHFSGNIELVNYLNNWMVKNAENIVISNLRSNETLKVVKRFKNFRFRNFNRKIIFGNQEMNISTLRYVEIDNET